MSRPYVPPEPETPAERVQGEAGEGASVDQCTHWSTRPGFHPIRCTAPAGHYTEERDWHRVGFESWNDADGEYRA